MTQKYSIVFNGDDELKQELISLPAGWPSNHPAISAVLFYFSTHPELALDDLKYQQTLDLRPIWAPLLTNSGELTPYNFPPEILATVGNTLELQAALMLIHLCTSKRMSITVQGFTGKKTTQCRLLSIIRHTNTTGLSAFEKTPEQLLSLLTIKTDNDVASSEPNFTVIDEVLKLSPLNRCMLAYWVKDDLYLTDQSTSFENERCNLLKALWAFSQNHERNFSQKITSPLARSYIYTGTYASDEVVTDKLFLRTYENTENEHWAEMINLYAHIKTGLPQPQKKLNQVVEQCRESSLKYWLAYFLSYGHVVHSYDKTYNREKHFANLSEAFLIYRNLGDWLAATRALHSKSTLSTKQLNFRNANRYLEICLGIRLFLQDDLGIARVLNGISYVNSQLEEFSKAINYAKEAIKYLEDSLQYEELAFTYSQMSWYCFLQDQYELAIDYGNKTISTMEEKNVRTLPYRTKPDIHAQLGLAYFFHGDLDNAIVHSDYCESHKVDSTATGEIQRIILRALINEKREDAHLSEISFSFIPELLENNPEIDPHLALFYYRIMVNRYNEKDDVWKARKFSREGKALCETRKYYYSLKWFK